VVSNHGGRQLDSCVSSIEALPRIADALRQAGFSIDQDLKTKTTGRRLVRLHGSLLSHIVARMT
jgi:isopentenyl diphosphate isomerase/L-lactate dehydrogenase-like FMN-dependent dehydrogenase